MATDSASLYARIHELVRLIPAGSVATYGQLARLCGCSARQAGYAMAAAPDDVPWHRVINSRGEISPRKEGGESAQRGRLLDEGVTFDRRGRVDLGQVRWPGPSWAWLAANGYSVDGIE